MNSHDLTQNPAANHPATRTVTSSAAQARRESIFKSVIESRIDDAGRFLMDDNLGGWVQLPQRNLYAVDHVVRLFDRHISVQLQVKLDELRLSRPPRP